MESSVMNINEAFGANTFAGTVTRSASSSRLVNTFHFSKEASLLFKSRTRTEKKVELDVRNGLALRVTFLFAIHESDKIGLEKAKFVKNFFF